MGKRLPTALLLAALLPLGACGDDSGDDDLEGRTTSTSTDTGAGSGDSSAPRVDVVNFAFSPDRVTVRVGGTVSWRHGDSAPHTITADDGSFDSGTKNSGDTFEHTFSKAGDVTYKCTIHPSMKGTVSVSG
jgi:plastocyanin